VDFGIQQRLARDLSKVVPALSAAVVRTRYWTAQIEGYLAIVYALLVARLAAEPLLASAGWLRLDLSRFALPIRASTRRDQANLQAESHRHSGEREEDS
jgi:hypothetical protein